MAKRTSRTGNVRTAATPEAAGFWDRPVLLNMVADLLIVAAVAALAWAGSMAIQRLPIFPLREVVLTTAPQQVTRAQVEQAARLSAVGNFFTVDLDNARAMFEKLPWVKRAEVRRRWPDTLELALEEHIAVARWRQPDGESLLVGSEGEVFAAASEAELPVFVGPEGSAPRLLTRYLEFEKALASIGRRPRTLLLSSREAWQVRLDDGLLIELGRDEEAHPISERLARFVDYYPAALGRIEMAATVADMRYPNGFALRVVQKS